MPGHSYKGSSVPPGRFPAGTIPVLSATSGKGISWVWSGDNPTSWNVWLSDGGSPFALADTVTGSTRTDSGFGDENDLVYIVGVDGSGNQIVNPSNIVTLIL